VNGGPAAAGIVPARERPVRAMRIRMARNVNGSTHAGVPASHWRGFALDVLPSDR
jgi:hypothetical protein